MTKSYLQLHVCHICKINCKLHAMLRILHTHST